MTAEVGQNRKTVRSGWKNFQGKALETCCPIEQPGVECNEGHCQNPMPELLI